MFLTFSCISQHPNKYINSNKIQIYQNPNSQYPTKKKIIKSEINPKSESKRIGNEIDPEEDRPRASRSMIRRDDLGGTIWVRDLRNGFDGRARLSEEWVRRTSSTIWRMGSWSDDWVRRTSSTIWGMGSRSDDWGIARRTSSVLGFLGSSELLDRSRLRRCWVLVRSLFRVVSLSLSLALSLFYAWPGNGLKVKWFCKMISGQMRQILVKLKWFSVNSIFHSYQTRGFYGKWFPETVFSQFKRSLNEKK